MTAFTAVHAPATLDRDADRLLALLATPWPWDVRPAIVDGRPVVVATVPSGTGERRTRWLDAVVRAVAAGTRSEDPLAAAGAGLVLDTAGEAGRDAVCDMVRWVAVGKGWQPLDAEGPGLRLAVGGEHALPPLEVASCPTGLRVERPLPLLPLRGAPAVVRLAAARAVLLVNATLRGARLVARDPAALTFAVECCLPPDDPEETEIECALEGVRHAGPYAAGVLECLRNPAVATEYAAAHCPQEGG